MFSVLRLLSVAISRDSRSIQKSFIFIDKVRHLLVTAKIIWKKFDEFTEFFHFFRSDIKIYSIGYNLGIFETNCIISGIILGEWIDLSDWNGEWALGGTLKCAMQINY